MKTINLNDKITVKLTSYGEYLYDKSFLDLKLPIPKHGKEIEMEIWDMAHIFGDYLYNGCDMPFESTVMAYKPCS